MVLRKKKPAADADSTPAKKKVSRKKAPAKKKAAPKTTEGSGPSGTTSGAGVNATWIAVFEKNEQVDPEERLTDEQISEFMKSEFPDLEAKLFEHVALARGKYNRGGFHKKGKSGKVTRPKIHSNPHTPFDASGRSERTKHSRGGHAANPGRTFTHQKDFKSHKK